jgi:hypothetical protein
MQIHLTFGDLMRLAMNYKIEKDGNTVTIGLPTMAKVEVDHPKNVGKLEFWLDSEDPRASSQW